VKLLLDQNLSHKLVEVVRQWFPGSAHVKDFRLDRAPDSAIWEVAKEKGFVIVSKDDDFHQRSFVLGAPPKVIWLAYGNCSTGDIAKGLTGSESLIRSFHSHEEAAFLILSREDA
jgi:predicted nuclease of predicted toxin-antitoxin system